MGFHYRRNQGNNWSSDEGSSFPYRGQGITFTSLEAAFKAFPDMRYNIDMKQTDPLIEEVSCKLIRQNNMQNKVLAASFTHTNNVAFRKVCPEVTTSADQTETTIFVFVTFAYPGRTVTPEYKAFEVPIQQSGIPVVTQNFVNAAHERSLRVDVWTIDDPRVMKDLVSLGFGAINTERPDPLKQVLGR